MCLQTQLQAQVIVPADSLKLDSLRADTNRNAANVARQYDFGDLTKAIFHPKRKDEPARQGSGITVVPNVAANPTIGAQLGIKAVAGKKLGTDPNTYLSVAATSASVTSKGILYFYINHNIFTPGNKWNIQGNMVAAKSVTPDFGLGIGRQTAATNTTDKILANSARKGYALHSQYYNFRQKIYKEVEKNLFVGGGISAEIRRKISQSDTINNNTPSSIYNNRHGFPQDHYVSSGFLFNVEYITRDNPNRAYKGIYADVGIRVNQTWIGSTKNAMQLTTDFRKYISLSAISPETVIAFWNGDHTC